MELLESLCHLHGPSGNEKAVKDFIINYVRENSDKWAVQPQVVEGEHLMDCVYLVFGNPRTAVFAHMDSIGFTVGYDNQLIKIGSPETQTGWELVGEDSQGAIECKIVKDEESNYLVTDCTRTLDRGTELVFKCNFREDEEYIQSCYLDNRLGVWNALKLCETLENGIIAFSCWEEHGGGSVKFLAKDMYEKYGVRQALVSDVTWVTNGIHHGKGAVVSMRDMSIPRRSFLNKVISIAEDSGIPFQKEVEGAGGSDARELQASPYPFDWCFVGPPEDNVHSPNEKVHKADIDSLRKLYEVLMERL